MPIFNSLLFLFFLMVFGLIIFVWLLYLRNIRLFFLIVFIFDIRLLLNQRKFFFYVYSPFNRRKSLTYLSQKDRSLYFAFTIHVQTYKHCNKLKFLNIRQISLDKRSKTFKRYVLVVLFFIDLLIQFFCVIIALGFTDKLDEAELDIGSAAFKGVFL